MKIKVKTPKQMETNNQNHQNQTNLKQMERNQHSLLVKSVLFKTRRLLVHQGCQLPKSPDKIEAIQSEDMSDSESEDEIPEKTKCVVCKKASPYWNKKHIFSQLGQVRQV